MSVNSGVSARRPSLGIAKPRRGSANPKDFSGSFASSLQSMRKEWFPWQSQSWFEFEALGHAKRPVLLLILAFLTFFSTIFLLGLRLSSGNIPENKRLSLSLEGTDDIQVPNGNLHHTNYGFHRASFTTAIPMYYINLDKSQERRESMEETFGKCGRLVRVPAVDGAIFRNLPGRKEYLKAARASAGELALFYSQLKAIKYAYDEGQSTAIIFEDDVSAALVPFWRHTPDELVQIMDDRNESWDAIRLQYAFPISDIWGPLQRWKENPDEILRDATSELLMGAAAYVISREGMKSVLAQYTTSTGELDCVAGRLDRLPCMADWLLFRRLKTFIVTPPMFVQGLFAESTAVRENDNWKTQQQAFVDSLLWAMEDHEVKRAAGQASSVQSRTKIFRNSQQSRWSVETDVNGIIFVLHRLVKRLTGIAL